jgi:hypothetical protein
MAGIKIVVAITEFISPPSYIRKCSIAEKAGPQQFRTLKPAEQRRRKRKKPGNAPGFF